MAIHTLTLDLPRNTAGCHFVVVVLSYNDAWYKIKDRSDRYRGLTMQSAGR